MKDEPTSFDLSPKKVITLLKIGSDVGGIPNQTHQQKADLLSDRLSETLPVYYSAEEKPSGKLRRLRHTIGVLAGEPIGKLLQNPKTDIAIIRMTKDYGRKLSTSAKSEAEHHAANTIYYAAIAHALVCHDRKITKYSRKDLHESFFQLSQEDWIPKSLCDLFTKASEYCEVKVK